jgi:hypothetical protein
MKYFAHGLFVLGLTLSLQATAANNLIGQYNGKIKEVSGYPGSAGDTCTVTIGTASNYGGSTSFSINGIEPILFENRQIDKDIDSGKKLIKLMTGGSVYKDKEVVVVKLGDDGTPTYVKTMRMSNSTHTKKSIDCDGLVKKQAG